MTMMANYNMAIWPLQIVVYILTITILVLLFKGAKHSGRIFSSCLGVLWIWVGFVFNYLYFSKISPGAFLFAVLFLVQGFLFLYFGAIKERLVFVFKAKLKSIVGLLIVAYSLIGYPSIEYLLNRGYPEILPFGLAPCPLTVFTLGMLLLMKNEFPVIMAIIPLLYSFGSIIPVSVGVFEDIGLLTAGILFLLFFLLEKRKKNPETEMRVGA